MNERIRELERQATDYYSNGQERIFDRQKFAELIIQECAMLAYDGNLKRAIAHGGSHSDILKHFGVEE